MGKVNLDSLTIATPFYNEEEGLDNYFETLKKVYNLINYKVKLKFLFIDDGSTDSTKQKLFGYQKENPNYNINIFCHESNYGYGRTLKNSIKLCDTKYLITYDSDCTYDYRIIDNLIDQIIVQKQDIINVSFKLANTEIKTSLFRMILSWGGSFIYKILFSEIKNYKVKVFTCSFRIYDVKQIKDINLISEDFNCCAELMIRAMMKKLKIIEIPGKNFGRKYGYSKMKILRNVLSTLKTIFLIKKKN